jgi:hypothetical protein
MKINTTLELSPQDIVAVCNEEEATNLIIAASERIKVLVVSRNKAETAYNQLLVSMDECKGESQAIEVVCPSPAFEGEVNNAVPAPSADKPKGTLPNGRAWTAAEDDVMREHYPTEMPMSTIAGFLNRSVASVRNRAIVLKLHRVGSHSAAGKAQKSRRIAKNADVPIDMDADANVDGVDDMSCVAEEDMPILAELNDVSGYVREMQEHIRAKKLAAKYGKKAMEGTPVVVNKNTVVIKRKKSN